MIRVNNSKVKTTVFWQTLKEGVGEPALMLISWDGMIEIQQEGKSILVSTEALPEFIKALKEAASE